MVEVSIVIPTKNEEKYIGKVLGNIYNQSFKDFEVIVSDGNSTDKTKSEVVSLIPKFKKKGIDLIFISTKKKGVAVGRNLGAKKASGKYIYFFDSDVYPDKEFIKTTIAELKRRKLSMGTVKSIPSDKRLKNRSFHIFMNRSLAFLQFTPFPAAFGHCIICSKKSFNKIRGFDPDIFLGEDTTFIVRGRRLRFRFRVLKSKKLIVSTRRLNTEGSLWVTIR
ncbi:MAG: glycosyltransferase family 2 protein, partial [Candidatus Nanoarchaeia archaeon]|nr:glycosyltransferase family 2 protein [Candidatus Nanoarchaeia archaeon]